MSYVLPVVNFVLLFNVIILSIVFTQAESVHYQYKIIIRNNTVHAICQDMNTILYSSVL